MNHTLASVVFPSHRRGIAGLTYMRPVALLFAAGFLIQAGEALCQDPLASRDTGKYTLTDKAGQQTILTVSKVRAGLDQEFYLGEIHYWWDAADRRYYRRGSLYCLYFELLSPGIYKYSVYDTWWNRTVESGSAR